MADDGYEVIGPEKVKSQVKFIPPPPCPQVLPESQSPDAAVAAAGAAAARPPPPPPQPAAPAPISQHETVMAKSVLSEVSKKDSDVTLNTNRSTLKSKKKKSQISERNERNGAHQRPNSCDTLLLSFTCVIFIIVLAVSIPMCLTAFGTFEIDAIKKTLEQEK